MNLRGDLAIWHTPFVFVHILSAQMILATFAIATSPSSLPIAKARTAVGRPILYTLKIDHNKLFQYSFGRKGVLILGILTGVPFRAHAFVTDAMASINAQTSIKVQENSLAMIVIVV